MNRKIVNLAEKTENNLAKEYFKKIVDKKYIQLQVKQDNMKKAFLKFMEKRE